MNLAAREFSGWGIRPVLDQADELTGLASVRNRESEGVACDPPDPELAKSLPAPCPLSGELLKEAIVAQEEGLPFLKLLL